MPKITCTYAIEHLCLYSHETLKYIKKEDISANHEYKGDLPEMPKRRRDRSQEVIDEAEGEAKNWSALMDEKVGHSTLISVTPQHPRNSGTNQQGYMFSILTPPPPWGGGMEI